MIVSRIACVLSVVASPAGCETSSTGTTPADAGTPVGSPCTPSPELSASFGGFLDLEVTVDPSSTQCASGVCLVNHFRGRVSCPYGQDANGQALSGAHACVVPGTTTPIAPNAPMSGNKVAAQCTDRRADKVVTCSCRCANVNGQTGDGPTYCACPMGTECVALVTSIGGSGDTLAGSYCVPTGTKYDPAMSCQVACEPQAAPCP
jgi:hypothetical protein